MTLKEFLTSIADSIRKKTGETDQIPASEFSSRIEAIETGIDTSDATAIDTDIKAGKSAYVDGKKIDGKMPTASITYASTSPVTISSDGKVSARIQCSTGGYMSKFDSTNTVGYVKVFNGGKAYNATIGENGTGISGGQYLINGINIPGDGNLKSEYIKDGVTIFGVKGSYEGDGVVNAVTETVTATARAKGRIMFELSNPIKQLISYSILANQQSSTVYYALIYSSGEGMYQCAYGAEDGDYDIRLASAGQVEIEISGNYIDFDDTAGSGFDDAVPKNCTCVGTFTYIAQ